MTEREKQEVKKMWEQGISVNQISRLLPYNQYKTLKDIKKLKKEGFLKPRSIYEINAQKVADMYANNKNLLEIANCLGLSMGYVAELLQYKKIKHPRYTNFRKREINEKAKNIISDLNKKIPQSEIARKYEVSRQYVGQLKERIKE